MAEVRAAVDTFVDLYNDQWVPEKNGFISPSAAREVWYTRQARGGFRRVSQIRVQKSACGTLS